MLGFIPPPTPSCVSPLGMESYKVPNQRITASSSWHHNYGPSNARLNFKGGNGLTGAWSSRYNNYQQWLIVSSSLNT